MCLISVRTLFIAWHVSEAPRGSQIWPGCRRSHPWILQWLLIERCTKKSNDFLFYFFYGELSKKSFCVVLCRLIWLFSVVYSVPKAHKRSDQNVRVLKEMISPNCHNTVWPKPGYITHNVCVDDKSSINVMWTSPDLSFNYLQKQLSAFLILRYLFFYLWRPSGDIITSTFFVLRFLVIYFAMA